MEEAPAAVSRRRVARTAGVMYLLVIIFGMFAELYVGLSLVVPGDAAKTARNIEAHEWLFRAGFMSGLFHHTCFLLLILLLFKLLKSVNRNQALLMVVFGLCAVPIMMLNMLNQFAALLLLGGSDYLAVFTPDQLQALAMLFLDLHNHGYYIAGMFSGLFLLPLGWLVYKSGFIPRFLGVLLILGGLGYLTELFVNFVVPSFEVLIFLGIGVAIVAELSFTFWLLLKGTRAEPLDDRDPDPALP
jgi:hypothetical protein